MSERTIRIELVLEPIGDAVDAGPGSGVSDETHSQEGPGACAAGEPLPPDGVRGSVVIDRDVITAMIVDMVTDLTEDRVVTSDRSDSCEVIRPHGRMADRIRIVSGPMQGSEGTVDESTPADYGIPVGEDLCIELDIGFREESIDSLMGGLVRHIIDDVPPEAISEAIRHASDRLVEHLDGIMQRRC